MYMYNNIHISRAARNVKNLPANNYGLRSRKSDSRSVRAHGAFVFQVASCVCLPKLAPRIFRFRAHVALGRFISAGTDFDLDANVYSCILVTRCTELLSDEPAVRELYAVEVEHHRFRRADLCRWTARLCSSDFVLEMMMMMMMMMMYLFTTVPHPHGHWQLQELLGNLIEMK